MGENVAEGIANADQVRIQGCGRPGVSSVSASHDSVRRQWLACVVAGQGRGACKHAMHRRLIQMHGVTGWLESQQGVHCAVHAAGQKQISARAALIGVPKRDLLPLCHNAHSFTKTSIHTRGRHTHCVRAFPLVTTAAAAAATVCVVPAERDHCPA
jgi:hypothetical protein